MPSRRFHSKNRHGCVACKKRKVKCDIKRPVCGNCARRKEECVYLIGEPIRSLHATSRIPQSQSSNTATTTTLSRRPRKEDVLHLSPAADLSFLERFVSEVSRTLSDRPESQQTWALSIGRRPSFQPSAIYLSHIIIAVSSLYTSLTQPTLTAQERKWYQEKGIYHQNAALALMQPALESLKEERSNSNSHIEGLFGAAWLVFLFSVALPRPAERKDWVVDEIVELSELAKGVIAIIMATRDMSIEDEEEGNTAVMTGPLAAFFSHFLPWKHRNVSPSERKRNLPAASLQPILATIESNDDDDDDDDRSIINLISPQKRQLYYHAIDELSQTMTAMTLNFRHPAIVFMWLIGTQRAFMQLIADRDEIALRIFRVYGLWAMQVEHVWFARRWGRSVVEGVDMVFASGRPV